MFISWLLKYLDVKGISTWQSSDSVSSLILSEFDWLTINFACKYIHNEIDLQEDYTGVGALVLKRFREERGLETIWSLNFESGIQAHVLKHEMDVLKQRKRCSKTGNHTIECFGSPFESLFVSHFVSSLNSKSLPWRRRGCEKKEALLLTETSRS
mgnify:CR=1 FL=1